MTGAVKHISVCICTYKRPLLLRRLLQDLAHQDTGDQFTYSIVVADNDRLRSAEPVVTEFCASSKIPVTYCVEPRQNIALARNKAVENACGDFIAFIDDDEFPTPDWLLALYRACDEYRADGVLGPVKPHFDETPPQWVIKGRFYDRPYYPTGQLVEWRKGRSGNLLLNRRMLSAVQQPFRAEFRAGEDQDFLRRMIESGYRFIWCDEAVVYEIVPPSRWDPAVMFKRALLRGATARLQPTCGVLDIAKSVVAVLVYTAALPFALVFGHHRFMSLLVKLCDHLGKLLAVLGINPIKAPYVTD